MDESVPGRLAEFKQTLTDALARAIERHPEAGEQKLRDQFQPFLTKLEEANQEYANQLTASQSEPRDIPVDIASPASPPQPRGAKSRVDFILQHHPKNGEVEATVDRLLNRGPAPKPQFGAFADWANESVSASIPSVDVDSIAPAPPKVSHGNYENVAQWADSTSVKNDPLAQAAPVIDPSASPSVSGAAPRPSSYDDFAEWIASTGWKTPAGAELKPDDPKAVEIARQQFLAWKSGKDSNNKDEPPKPSP